MALSPDGKTLHAGHATSFGSDIAAIAVAPDGDVYVYGTAGLSSVNPQTPA